MQQARQDLEGLGLRMPPAFKSLIRKWTETTYARAASTAQEALVEELSSSEEGRAALRKHGLL